MTEPLTALLSAIPGLASAGAAIAKASGENERNAQLIEFQRFIIQLQSSIAAIQNENAALLRDKDDLEKKIVGMENWKREKKRYALVTILEGAVAYALKESMSQGEAAHWLCTNCFDGGKKKILNRVDGLADSPCLFVLLVVLNFNLLFAGLFRLNMLLGKPRISNWLVMADRFAPAYRQR